MSEKIRTRKLLLILSLSLFLPLLVVLFVSSIITSSAVGGGRSSNSNPPYCPRATPVPPPMVEPVTSPTNELNQTIDVFFHHGEVITVTAESGAFYEPCNLDINTCDVAINVRLLPNIIHHLSVTGKVKLIVRPDGCKYGGYTMSTSTDRNGDPLVIIQEFHGIRYFPMIIGEH